MPVAVDSIPRSINVYEFLFGGTNPFRRLPKVVVTLTPSYRDRNDHGGRGLRGYAKVPLSLGVRRLGPTTTTTVSPLGDAGLMASFV